MPNLPNYELIGLALFVLLSILPLFFSLSFITPRLKSLRRIRESWKPMVLVASVTASIYIGVSVDAFWIEPNHPAVTTITLDGPFEKPLRLLHVSDLHLEEQMNPRDNWLIEKVQELRPDLIVVTGDTHQIGNMQVESLRNVLKHLQAPMGVYHCTGYDDVRVLKKAAPHIVYLENKSTVLESGSKTIGIAGLLGGGAHTAHSAHSAQYAAISECDYRIVMNHTPEMADNAVDQGVDLYLCGHTHGGQVRIPLWGAIITNSSTGKRFEAGLFKLKDTSVFTSRGFGLEPRPAPQVRFFCRPEITLFKIGRN